MDDTLLPPLDASVGARLKEIKSADLLVGVPSFNNERTIGHVVRAIVAGIARHFPDMKAVLVNSDGGSTDRTRDVVARTEVGDLAEILVDAAPSSPTARIVTPYQGLPGKGSALRTIFRVAAELDARACCVVDSDLRSITPEWIQLLLAPVVRHAFEFVAPLYARHRYDGTITNLIVYPLTRSLYGRRVRQPIGGDFGFSGDLAERFLAYDAWEGPVARYGIDIFMTTTALAEGRRVCQSFLGAKLHDPKDPGADLQPMMVQVVSTLFELMEHHEAAWTASKGSTPVRVFGFPYATGVEPVPVKVDRLVSIFRQACSDLRGVWEGFLSAPLVAAIVAAGEGSGPVSIPDETWVRLILDSAAGWHRRRIDRDAILKSLIPLYLGKVASFVEDTREGTAEDAEARIERLAEAFESGKDSLRAAWDGAPPLS